MSPEAAIAYLRDKWQDWLALPAKIERLMSRAAYVQGIARMQGRTDAADEAGRTIESLAALRGGVIAVQGKVEWARKLIAGSDAGNEMGAVPLVVGLAAIAAAAGMALIYKALAHQERVLEDIEAGILPPEALGTGGIGGAVGRGIGQALLPVALVGGLLWAGSNFIKRRAA